MGACRAEMTVGGRISACVVYCRAVLASMQSDPGLATIPVIVLSETDSEEELVEALATGAQRFTLRLSSLPQQRFDFGEHVEQLHIEQGGRAGDVRAAVGPP